MNFIGEHLLPGQLGHLFIIISLVASLAAAFSYWKSVNHTDEAEQQRWKKLGRWFFYAEFISIISVFGILFYIIQHHYFEYKYAWQHSNLSLEFKYLFSCFWEGQEGSFILWGVWHVILAFFIVRKKGEWESPVMAIISAVQFFISLMLLGIYVGETKIGSNPFVLLRNEMQAPIFSRPDYLQYLKDGNGLNPLLQNYWMVIHPPVLFLGFASGLIPFAFALAGWWTNKKQTWTKPVMSWALLSAAVLGLGIMMGGAWAYESLSFGGYWAWDPVENASFVPWLFLIAGIHTLLIYKHTGRALVSTYLYFILAFLFILYSTFLTRSGILGDTSVHAFTDLGMNGLLTTFLYFFVWLPVWTTADSKKRILFILISILLFGLGYFWGGSILLSALLALVLCYLNLTKILKPIKDEEQVLSREFWMNIGAIILLLASLFITIATSLPVGNKLFGSKLSLGNDVEFAYNKIMVFVGMLLALLTAITHYLKFKNTDKKYFSKRIALPFFSAIIISALILILGNINYTKHGYGFLGAIYLMLVCSIFTVIANVYYLVLSKKFQLLRMGGNLAHFGFGIFLIGVIISSAKKEVLSLNNNAQNIMQEDNSIIGSTGENITVFKNHPIQAKDYEVNYFYDSVHPKKPLWFYKIQFNNKEKKNQFTLMPNAFVNYKGNMGLMANPDAKHFWNKDIFAYITSLPDPQAIDSSKFKTKWMLAGDTCFFSKGYFVMKELRNQTNLPKDLFKKGDSLFSVILNVHTLQNNKPDSLEKMLSLAKYKQYYISIPDTIHKENLILNFVEKNNNKALIKYFDEDASKYLTLKIYKFPFIILVWAGTVIMIIGFLLSMIKRIVKSE